MTVKINPIYVILTILAICIVYLYFQNVSLRKQVDESKVQDLQKEKTTILKVDSLFSKKQKDHIRKTDSLFNTLQKKDSILERKNKLQDEKIRSINIPSNLLPNF